MVFHVLISSFPGGVLVANLVGATISIFVGLVAAADARIRAAAPVAGGDGETIP